MAVPHFGRGEYSGIWHTRKQGRGCMKAEIISVGTELLLGHTVNTDTVFVARELSALGMDLLYCCIVGDNPTRLRSALACAFERSELIITTGGLGPTNDDLTKETVARMAGVKLVLHEESLEHIKHYFKGRSISENQQKQALLPEGCTVFRNDAGTAPGCAFKTATKKIVVMLPGPPSELVPMLEKSVVPYLKQQQTAAIHSKMIRTFGIGEGAGAQLLTDLTESENPTVATYAKENEMFVRVTAKAHTEKDAIALCRPMVEEVCRRLGDVVYGVDVENLESVVVNELAARKLHIATAESCTGGLLAKRLTDIPGASNVFGMGVVSYANEAKIQLLGVPENVLLEHGAVSEPVAKAMATGIRERAGNGLGVGITGIAGPDGGTAEKPVGLVYIALSDGEKVWCRTMLPPGKIPSRQWLRDRAASHALDLVRRYLFGLSLERS